MTMNAPTSLPTTMATDAAPSVPGGASARAAALKLSLDSEATSSEPAGESSATPATPASGASLPADSGAAVPGAPSAAQQAAAERMARINKVRERDRAAEEERAQRTQAKAKDSEFETLRKRVAELEPYKGALADEDALLALAEREGVGAEKLVAAIRKRLTDPSAVAQRQVQTEAEKIRAEMKAQNDAHRKEIEALKAEKAAAEETRAIETKTTTFLTDAKAKAETHPRTARLLAKHKEDGLIGFANHHVAPHLPDGYSSEELHDHLEQLLDELDAFGGPAVTQSASPANGASQPPKKNGAAQPATTLSNALTSGRESLVEDVPLHKLSREERVRRARESNERE